MKSQAKVWAVYNHKINNPRQMKDPLLSEDMRKSLYEGENSLDSKMRKSLEKKYQKTLCLSARPAFLVLAGQDSELGTERQKWLEKFSKEEVLKRSHFEEFVRALLTESVMPEAEVEKANLTRINELYHQVGCALEQRAQTDFQKVSRDLEGQVSKLGKALEEIARNAQESTRRLKDELVDKMIGDIRSEVMDKIKKGIGSDFELKECLKEIIEEHKSELQEKTEERIGNLQEKSQEACQEKLALMKSELKHQGVFEVEGFEASFDYMLDIETESGISWGGLAGTAIGIPFLFIPGLNLAVIAFGIVGIAWGAVNACYNFFFGPSKEEKQRGAVNKELGVLKLKLREQLKTPLDRVAKDFCQKIKGMARPFEGLLENYSNASGELRSAGQRLLAFDAFNWLEILSHKGGEKILDQEHFSQDVSDILAFLQRGEALGVELPSHLRKKLESIKTQENEKIKVALVGGFSEGKTSLALAWLGKSREDMKISQAESSSEVKIYDIGEEMELVDTPGLFGFKEKNIGADASEAYKEITRKYVSEAQLLLYVLNPSNPIKESHKEELHWLFRELNLLPRTVFVLGRFDTVSDLEDVEDFARNLEIKKKNVLERLRELIGLTEEESREISICAVAPNPFDEPAGFWEKPENQEEWRELSHIEDLRKATEEKLAVAGGAEGVKRSTALTIFKDVTQRQMEPALDSMIAAKRDWQLAVEKAQEEKPRLGRYEREVKEAQAALRRRLSSLLTDIIVECKSTDQGSFGEFFERRIGKEGIVLNTEIQSVYDEELDKVGQQIAELGVSFSQESSNWDWMKSLGLMGGKVAQSGVINNGTILAARNTLGLGVKFKPWGAIKLASKANFVLAAAGPVIEGVITLKKIYDAHKFEEARAAIAGALEEQRRGLLENLDAPDFLGKNFPTLVVFQKFFTELLKEAERFRKREQEMRAWIEIGKRLADRFGVVLPALSNLPQISGGAGDLKQIPAS